MGMPSPGRWQKERSSELQRDSTIRPAPGDRAGLGTNGHVQTAWGTAGAKHSPVCFESDGLGACWCFYVAVSRKVYT